MGTGYVRNDASDNIAAGKTARAADIDGEFDAIQDAFDNSTGHTHDGTSSEGAPITVTGPGQEYVSGASDFSPKTDSTYTLGTTSVRWANGFFDTLTAPAANIDVVTGSLTGNVTGNLTGDVTGDVTGNVTGALTGNADTATSLETSRTISISGDVTGSVSFDGTANVDIVATIDGANHTHDLAQITDAGTIASQDANNVTITGGSITGITDLAIEDGGTGASDVHGARTNLGLARISSTLYESTDNIDSNSLQSGWYRVLTGATGTKPGSETDFNLFILKRASNNNVTQIGYTDDAQIWTRHYDSSWSAWTRAIQSDEVTTFALTLLDDADAATFRTTLGLLGGATRSVSADPDFSVNAGSLADRGVIATKIASDISAAAQSTALGAVGTYAFLRHKTTQTNITAGTTYDGADLAYAGVQVTATNANQAFSTTAGASPSGTWRAMGNAEGVVTSGYFAATLFVRIS